MIDLVRRTKAFLSGVNSPGNLDSSRHKLEIASQLLAEWLDPNIITRDVTPLTPLERRHAYEVKLDAHEALKDSDHAE